MPRDYLKSQKTEYLPEEDLQNIRKEDRWNPLWHPGIELRTFWLVYNITPEPSSWILP